MSDERGVVALQGLPFRSKSGRVTTGDGFVRLDVPRWLGESAWQVPADEVGVADLAAVGWGSGGEVFRDRLAMPYLSTRTRFAAPTLVLLFRVPQRLPAGFGHIRNRDGLVDGVTLRVADSARALQTLSEGGAIAVGDPSRFLRQHREVVEDADERAAILHEDRAGTRLRQGSTVLLYVALFLVTWLFASGDLSPVRWIAPVVAVILAVVLRLRSNQLARR